MPVFTVTAPNGETYKVTAPRGTTKDELVSYVKAQIRGSSPVDYGSDDFEYKSDETSYIRDVTDIASGFASGLPKAAGAIVSLGSYVPGLHKIADPVAEALQSTGEWMDEVLLSDRQSLQTSKIKLYAIIPRRME